MTDRTTPRSDVTRAKTARRRPWAPPSKLDAPKPKDGYKHRWIRTHLRGDDDQMNVHSRLREGYEPVRADEYPDRQDLPSVAEGKYKGVIGIGGLVLMRCPIEVKEDRDEYFRNLTDTKTKAIENDLHKEEHPSMPISQERQSRVTFGGKKS